MSKKFVLFKYLLVATSKTQSIEVQNLSSLENNIFLAAKEQILDNGSGSMKVWRVLKNSLNEVQSNGILYSSEIYYILYTYSYNGSNKEILYYWQVIVFEFYLFNNFNTSRCQLIFLYNQGQESKENAQTQLTLSQEDPVAKANVKARILQSNQPPHFLAAFKGKLVIMDGEYKENLPKTYLLQMQGNQIFNAYGQQVQNQSNILSYFILFILLN